MQVCGMKYVNKSSAIAQLVVQCCTNGIIAFECGVPFFKALFLSNV